MRVLAEIERRAAAGETVALATVVATEGSSPAESSMRMLVAREGRVAGTIGGGRVEAAIEAKAREVLERGVPEVLAFTLDDALADEGGMICGGTVRILVERIAPPAAWAGAARAMVSKGRRGALLARIGPRDVARVLHEGAAADPYLADDRARLEGEVFVEPLVRPRCIVFGAGHVGAAIARVARVADFGVAVVEDRPDHAAAAEADEVVCSDLVEGFATLDPSPFDYVVSTTRGHGIDLSCVRAALRSPARYVGMLASRRKTAAVREALAKEGIDAERLHAPVGLDLGARSAGEIAVSVVAQLIKVRRLGRGDR
jgi:xanthine dehydrogenase accessory factor